MYHLIRILLWTTVLTWCVSLYVGIDMLKLQFWGELTKGDIIWNQTNDQEKCIFPKDVSVLLKINQAEYLQKWTPSKEICLKQPISLDFWVDVHQSPPLLIYANQLSSREMIAFNVQWISTLLLVILIFLSRIFKARHLAKHGHHKHPHKNENERIAFFDFDKQDKLDDLLDDD